MTDAVSRLCAIMAELRDPDGGCPWDLEQSFASIAPHTIEEAYEVADAIDSGDMNALKGELGDLLFNVVYHAQMASEIGAFDFDEVAATIEDKIVRRHPHVFGTESVASVEDQTRAWEQQKAAERAEKAATEGRVPSALDDVARGLPAHMRAQKLLNRAARVGFDWGNALTFLEKLEGEVAELRVELSTADQSSAIAPNRVERVIDELGDVLFIAIGLARFLGSDPETILRRTNDKFERRFRGIEALAAAQNQRLQDLPLATLIAFWQQVKDNEGKATAG